MYSDDDLLPLSGIQHFAFCPRQWALIHIEKAWTESARTAQGRMMHEKADDPYERESRRDLLISRAVPLVSHSLGFFGIADVIEFIRVNDGGVSIPERSGIWLPYPVEYKVGKPKIDDCDTVQLCAQGICLEEDYGIFIQKGYMYYGTPRRRMEVEFNGDLRDRTASLAETIHAVYEQKTIPSAKKTSKCRSCSLRDECMPGVFRSAKDYLRTYIETMSSDCEEGDG